MKYLTGRIVAFAALVGILASCSSFQPAVDTAAPLRVAYASRWGDYTMIVAEEGGFFTRYGVDVEPVYYATSFDSLADLAASHLDGGLMAIGDTVNVESHTGIKVVAVSDDGGFSTIVSTSGITIVSELKGRRIGVELGTSQELVVTQMLAAAGVQTSDVTLYNLHPEDVPSALGARVDAAFTWEPFASQAVARGNRVLYSSREGAGLSPTVIAFRQSVVEARPDEIRSFLKAWFAATEFRKQNPDETRQMIANHYGLRTQELRIDPNMQLLGRDQNYPYFLQTNAANTLSLFTITRLNAEFLMRIGVLPDMPDLTAMLDSSYLK